MNENCIDSLVSSRIQQMLTKLGKTQTQVSKEIGISKNAMSNYVAGNRIPDTITCLRLSTALGISMEWLLTGKDRTYQREDNRASLNGEALSSDELLLLQSYRKLIDNDKDTVLGKIARLLTRYETEKKVSTGDLINKNIIVKPKTHKHVSSLKRDIKVYTQSASAGLGNYLNDDSLYETVSIDASKLPHNADFGIKISGDSMQPMINDGDIVWVEEKIKIDDGEIGVFVLNGEAFCKKLKIDQSKQCLYLLSTNKNYLPIKVGESDLFKTVGRVIFFNA